MAEYAAPAEGHAVRAEARGRPRPGEHPAGLGRGDRRRGRRHPRGGREVRRRGALAAQRHRRQGRAPAQGRRRHHAARLQGRLLAVRERRLGQHHRARRSSAARGLPPCCPRRSRRCGARPTSPSSSARCSPWAPSRRCTATPPSELKQRFLPNMVSGKWTGTMNLTEPQAGSDLSLVRTKAVPQADGTYTLTGAEDLHHLRRAGLHREHRAHGARPRRGRARGREGHLALRGAQVPREARTARSARGTA